MSDEPEGPARKADPPGTSGLWQTVRGWFGSRGQPRDLGGRRDSDPQLQEHRPTVGHTP